MYTIGKLVFHRRATSVYACTKCEDAASCYRCSVVCVSCLLDTTVRVSAKMDDPIEMRFGLGTHVGLRNHVLGGVRRSPSGEGAFFGTCPQWRHLGGLGGLRTPPKDCEV